METNVDDDFIYNNEVLTYFCWLVSIVLFMQMWFLIKGVTWKRGVEFLASVNEELKNSLSNIFASRATQ